ncbi:MAG: kelch repeat-containing protein [Candidatus Lutacidiplasmatales archaeon]
MVLTLLALPSWNPGSVSRPAVAAPAAILHASDAPSFRPAAIGGWNQSSQLFPTPRSYAAMAYDPTDNETVLFGGIGEAAVLNDTWVLKNRTWTELFPPVSPSARMGARMVYDAHAGYLLLFGGSQGYYTFRAGLSDTWAFSNGTWTILHPKASPPKLAFYGLAYDPTGNFALLFGGRDSRAYDVNQTWTFNGHTWSRVTTPSGLSPRYTPSLAFDAVDGYLLLFGGFDGCGAACHDTWGFSHGVWQKIHPLVSPPSRGGASLVNDPSDGFVVMIGGYNLRTYVPNDTWAYANGSWSKVNVTGASPSPRDDAMVTYDPVAHRVVLFGGQSDFFSDTWSFHAGRWKVYVDTPPTARLAANAVWDAADGYGLLFGGCSDDLCAQPMFGDTWTFVHGVWTDITPTLNVSPPARSLGQMAYDPIDKEVVLFGGITHLGSGAVLVLQDTWVFSHGRWTNLTGNLSKAPPPRYRAGFAYDPVDRYVLLFGGTSAVYPKGVLYNDTWAFSHQRWRSLSATVTGAPPGRYRATMAYDPYAKDVVLYGGCTANACPSNDTWLYRHGAWSNATATFATGPSPRVYPAFGYDPSGGFLILFGGGLTFYGPIYNDTWTFASGSWANVSFARSPPARLEAAMFYDPTDGYMVLCGGYDAYGDLLGDSWELS